MAGCNRDICGIYQRCEGCDLDLVDTNNLQAQADIIAERAPHLLARQFHRVEGRTICGND
jgi:hypothetical protein